MRQVASSKSDFREVATSFPLLGSFVNVAHDYEFASLARDRRYERAYVTTEFFDSSRFPDWAALFSCQNFPRQN